MRCCFRNHSRAQRLWNAWPQGVTTTLGEMRPLQSSRGAVAESVTGAGCTARRVAGCAQGTAGGPRTRTPGDRPLALELLLERPLLDERAQQATEMR